MHIQQLPQARETHLMPTRSPTLMLDFSAPGPSLTTLPTPSCPPTCPACVGYGRPFHFPGVSPHRTEEDSKPVVPPTRSTVPNSSSHHSQNGKRLNEFCSYKVRLGYPHAKLLAVAVVQINEDFSWTRLWRFHHLNLGGDIPWRIIHACLMLLRDFDLFTHFEECLRITE